jgi:hypothetical protein
MQELPVFACCTGLENFGRQTGISVDFQASESAIRF